MERLTFVDENGNVLFTSKGCDEDVGCTITQLAETRNIDLLNEIADRLANCEQRLKCYEDLEEQELLLKLQCKVGDIVYAYCSEFGVILSYFVERIVIDEHITYQCAAYSAPIGDCPSECLDEIELDISDFGKTVFLTLSEVEEP